MVTTTIEFPVNSGRLLFGHTFSGLEAYSILRKPKICEKPANQSVVLLKRSGSFLDELRFLNSQELSTRVELFGELINTNQT